VVDLYPNRNTTLWPMVKRSNLELRRSSCNHDSCEDTSPISVLANTEHLIKKLFSEIILMGKKLYPIMGSLARAVDILELVPTRLSFYENVVRGNRFQTLAQLHDGRTN
jgi:hypothetical protein